MSNYSFQSFNEILALVVGGRIVRWKGEEGVSESGAMVVGKEGYLYRISLVFQKNEFGSERVKDL